MVGDRKMEDVLLQYKRWLVSQERSAITVEKYLRDVRAFLVFARESGLSKELVLDYRNSLTEKSYLARSINSMLAAVNSYLRFLGREDCRVRNLKTQREVFCPSSKELSKTEYYRLLCAAKKKPRLYLLLQTIGGTGIRVSELKYFTVESVRRGEVEVNAKGKRRKILFPGKLRKQLLGYARAKGIDSGPIFRTRGGKPMDRSNIWAEMKGLCREARVERSKVFPHNLRKLFARSFYEIDRDLAKLADILGHSSIETTRIYIISSGDEHRRKIEQMKLVI